MPKQVRGSPKKKGKLTFEQLHMQPQSQSSRESGPTRKWHEGPWSVPPGMALALGSNRPELIRLAIGDVERGATEVNKELVIELMRLVAELMAVSNVHEAASEGRAQELEEIGHLVCEAQEALSQVRVKFIGKLTADSE